MLKYAYEKLHNKENKLYNLWIYKNGERMYVEFSSYNSGRFGRGKG